MLPSAHLNLPSLSDLCQWPRKSSCTNQCSLLIAALKEREKWSGQIICTYVLLHNCTMFLDIFQFIYIRYFILEKITLTVHIKVISFHLLMSFRNAEHSESGSENNNSESGLMKSGCTDSSKSTSSEL